MMIPLIIIWRRLTTQAFLFRKRANKDNPLAMPKSLRYELNNILWSQKRKIMTFDDGILKIYERVLVQDKGFMPVSKLRLKSSYYFSYEVIGVTKFL